MEETRSLICWKCNKKSPAGECIHCGALIADPNTVFEDEDQAMKKRPSMIMEISRPNRENIRIQVDKVRDIISNNFTIKKMAYSSQPVRPIFIVENPGSEIGNKFDALIVDSEGITPGFKPILRRSETGDDYRITFIYNTPPSSDYTRQLFTFGIITLISIIIAGMYNFNNFANASNIKLDGLQVFQTVFSLEVLLNSFKFSLVLLLILIIKDIIPIYNILRYKFSKIAPFYIPAPPFFEFGTLGSINRQITFHKTRKEMFRDTFWGSVLGWLVSSLIVIFSLSLAELNPTGASQINQTSLVANGSFEPIGLGLFAFIGNTLGLYSIDLTGGITSHYILDPITVAGLAGFYITGINLMPTSFFYGGFLIRSLTNKKVYSILSFVTIALFITINWLFAALFYFMHESVGEPIILNETSEKPNLHQLLIFIIVLIIILTFPIHVSLLPYY